MAQTTMRAIQIKEFNAPYHVSSVPRPKPGPNQVLVKIKAGGFCHTDLMALNNEMGSPLPYIGSHEPAGIIEECGSEVKDYKPGERVGALTFQATCGKCPDCKTGRTRYCDGPPKPKMKGITTDGGWSEFMVSDTASLVRLPDAVSFEVAACLMCAGTTVYNGILTADVEKGGSLAIMGLGGLGHIAVQLGKAMGYTVLAIDSKQEAIDLTNSAKHKADITMLASDEVEPVLKKLNSINPDKHGYLGVDATILASDNPKSFKLAADLTKKHGKLVLLGQPADGITMSYLDIIFKDIKLVGSLLGEPSHARELVNLVAKEGITVHIKTWKPEEAEDMRQQYLDGKTKGKNVVLF